MIKLVIDFGSMVAIPFLGVIGVLGAFRIRVTNYLGALLFVWFLLGLILIGGGVTPVGPGDIVSREEIRAWFSSDFVGVVNRIWIFGIGFGLPLYLICLLHEKRELSPYIKLLDKVLTLILFLLSLREFILEHPPSFM